jgi:cytochrome c oxidase subunit I
MYIVTAWIAFVIGGLMAMLMRLELMTPRITWVSAQAYSELFTVHAITMIFLFVMPLAAGLANYFVPIQIGAKDMAYPRINALSFWLIPPAIVLLWIGFLMRAISAQLPALYEVLPAFLQDIRPLATGWTGYVPLSTSLYSPSIGTDFWIIALVLLGTGSTLGAINFITTIVKLRRPGMTFHHMPLFCWSMLVTAFLLLLATPALTVALVMLLLDRNFATGFYNPIMGGDVMTWQHLFWFFGHPEVYILILPAMGMINEALPRMVRKPIFGYHAMAWAIAAIGVLGFAVWVHHMFTTGIDPRIRAAFMAMTMAIGIPTGIKIFNWLATIWQGDILFKAPMLFTAGFISMFVIGGINGVFTASIPLDYALHNTYWVVSHIHYVLFGGATMGLFAGMYYWWPKITGRMYSEKLAAWHFWTTLISLNVVFFTMHFKGIAGMPRGAATYPAFLQDMNILASLGAFGLGASQIFFFWMAFHSLKKGKPAPDNPWDAGPECLEWHEWANIEAPDEEGPRSVPGPGPGPGPGPTPASTLPHTRGARASEVES